MEEQLSLDNILGAEEIDSLFIGEQDTQDSQNESVENSANDENVSKEDSENNSSDKTEATEEINVNSLFTDTPESVSSGDDDIEVEEDTPSFEDSTSPKNFYSSIAKALKEEGIFPDLDDDSFSKISKPEEFRDLVDQLIKAGIDARYQRIDEALNSGMEPSQVKQYENTLLFLDSINEERITDESDEGEKLRKDLIYLDFINRGYSKDRAFKEVQKSLNAGTDIDDAKEALKSNADFFTERYNELVNAAKAEAAKAEDYRRELAEKLKTSILLDKQVFGELSVDNITRQKAYDNISKPIYRDPDTGDYYTAIQKYEKENRIDFLKNISLLYTLTNGFKNIDGLIKNKVRKEMKKGLKELENTLNNTSRTSTGNLKFASGVNEDPESFIGKGWKLDV